MKLYNANLDLLKSDLVQQILKTDDIEKQQALKIVLKRKILEIYKFQVFNLPDDFITNSYLIALNHTSDMDAPLVMSYYQLLKDTFHDSAPELCVFAKDDCFRFPDFERVLKSENVFTVDRNKNNAATLLNAIRWFKKRNNSKHFLSFVQGTIFDINKDEPKYIDERPFDFAASLGIKVLPGFLESPVANEVNRLVFNEPMTIEKHGSRDMQSLMNRTQWQERVIASQNSLFGLTGIKAREPIIDEDHQVRKVFRSIE